jgi:ankyrin repeat protein
MVRWLVAEMAAQEVTLDGRDHHGNTALHLAARSGNSGVCSVLLQHGADLTLKVGVAATQLEVGVAATRSRPHA